MLAAAAVKETVETQKDKIDAIPLDEAVKEADDLAIKKRDAYTQAIVWTNIPMLVKLCLLKATAAMIGCFSLLALFNAQCFAEYDLMYTISEHLGGKWHNLVRPLGWYAMILLGIATVFLALFQVWAAVSIEAAAFPYWLSVLLTSNISFPSFQRETNKIMESGLLKPLTETEMTQTGGVKGEGGLV